ncbi:uncharacterized protein LOC100902761 [Galendromus occidentalis]|uniref:Uncharacterized protein LOC100902761 n=1 Tax=Galendromus occidentalis TaxID=34638 RepID=A0AAJ6VV02_9ACAR|nr:uncharacterized protein LOC100902761 [Galendromus occidentalis]
MEELFQSVLSEWTLEKTSLAASAVILIGFLAVYKIYIRPLLPVRVKCWFCHKINVLPPDNLNRFDCRYCEQYNGFSDGGDYNKDIPAQRDPAINVFSAEARHTGAELSMYHNGLCEFCNNRQARKMIARNQFEPMNSKTEREEFEQYCRQLERNFSLCPSCERHVNTRISYQNAYLDPYVRRWISSRWHSRIGRFLYSDYMLLLCTFGPPGSFYLSGWCQAIPLIFVFLLLLSGAAKNKLTFLSYVFRAATVYTDLSGTLVDIQHRNLLNICSVICACVAAFGALQSIVTKLTGNKKKSSYPFSRVEDLSKVLSPLLSASYSKLKQTQKWVQQKAPSQLDSDLEALSLGKPSLSPRSQISRTQTQLSSNAPRTFVFGKAAPSSPGIVKRSRFGQSFEDLTPPPSQDNSSSDYFISASRWCCSEKISAAREKEDTNWDSRTTATQRTVHTVFHDPRESSQNATWALVVLLAALLLKLSWPDLLYVSRAAYNSISSRVVV